MNTDRSDVFFYGLYMDDRVLRDHAVQPVEPRRACAGGYALRIGRRATLVAREGERAHGMVYALTAAELARLYGAPGLEDYRPVPLQVRTDDGAELPVTCYLLTEAQPPGESDTVYADRLRRVLAQHGFPTDGVPAPWLELRPALQAEIPVLQQLIERSARALSAGYYTPAQTEAAIRHVFGVDSSLVADGTYLVVVDKGTIVACGGWSRRRTLYGGDQRRVGPPELLDPAKDAAKIRAFFVAPEQARRGIGRILLGACEAAARAAGFTRLELMATLPGVPLYSACGFHAAERTTDVLPDGTAIEFVRMERPIA